MAFNFDVKIDDREVKELFKRLLKRCKDLTPAMKVIGSTVKASVERNFEVGGRPTKWVPLAQATIKVKGHAQPLVRQGHLKGSVNYDASADRVVIGAGGPAEKYAAIHQFGGKAGRGLKVFIPARPYLVVQDEDWAEIKQVLTDHLMKVQ